MRSLIALIGMRVLIQGARGEGSPFLGNFVDILKAALPLKVSGVLVIHGLLIAAITWLMSLGTLWEWGLLKETVIVAVFTGIPLLIFAPLMLTVGQNYFVEYGKRLWG